MHHINASRCICMQTLPRWWVTGIASPRRCCRSTTPLPKRHCCLPSSTLQPGMHPSLPTLKSTANCIGGPSRQLGAYGVSRRGSAGSSPGMGLRPSSHNSLPLGSTCRQGDGTSQDASYIQSDWAPLLSTPAHPEHPSGTCSLRAWLAVWLNLAASLFDEVAIERLTRWPSKGLLLRHPTLHNCMLRFPAGHSATSGSAAAVLAAAFGDKTAFTVSTEYPGLAPRSFSSFSQVSSALEEVRCVMHGRDMLASHSPLSGSCD